MRLSGWGRHPVMDCTFARTRTRRDVADLVGRDGTLIARGNGRSYGDAALNRTLTVSMLAMDRMEAFDETTGLLTCESGVLLADLLDVFVPRGWMPAVVPGTALVTVGGMVAADVHGKNDHRDGSFGRHVDSLVVLVASGEALHCSRTENHDLFHATVGGMGLTGVILSASFFLRRIETAWVESDTTATRDLEDTMALFEEARDAPCSVAWVDCTATGARTGRSLVSRGRLAEVDALPPALARNPLRAKRPRTLDVPFDGPPGLLNGATVRVFNALYYRAGRLRAGSRLVHFHAFFFPLDRIGSWNRLYGRRGFAQYQCVLPGSESRRGLPELLECVASTRGGSFLAVLKRLGGRTGGLLSFPMPGYTLALDVPIRSGTARLMEALDRITHSHGGRVYLAKDAWCTPESLRLGYPQWAAFQRVREAVTGGTMKFASALSERIGL